MGDKQEPPSKSEVRVNNAATDSYNKSPEQKQFSDAKRKKKESDYHTVGGF